MTKRYDEEIEVTTDHAGDAVPVAFVWRGRRYEVDLPLATWLEAPEWADGGRCDRHYHRVLARRAGLLATGEVDADGFMRHVGAVYDVYHDDGVWRLARIWD